MSKLRLAGNNETSWRETTQNIIITYGETLVGIRCSQAKTTIITSVSMCTSAVTFGMIELRVHMASLRAPNSTMGIFVTLPGELNEVSDLTL